MNGAAAATPSVGEAIMSDSFRVAHLVSGRVGNLLRIQYSNSAPSDEWNASVLATLLR